MDARAIFAWTQSALALAVVIGGGALLAFNDHIDPTAIVGVIGVILGYFFGSSVSPAPLHLVGRTDPNGEKGGKGVAQ